MQKYTWQSQHAKANFAFLLREAENYPQYITVNGKLKAAVLSYGALKRMLADIRELDALKAKSGQTGQDSGEVVDSGQTGQNSDEIVDSGQTGQGTVDTSQCGQTGREIPD